MLGAVEVCTDDGALVRVPELKVRTLLAHLLVHCGETVPADRLIEDLWGERLPADPRGALQARVSQLRRVLDDAEPGTRELVASQPPGYRLNVPAAAVDAGRFADSLERARAEADPRARATLLDDALTLWRGPAYADVADALFARPSAIRLDEQRLAAVEERAEALLELGEHALLGGELAELVARHPLRERLRAAHMRALYLSGRPNDALDAYHELRTRLRDELGTDPGPELVALHRAVLAHDPGLRPAAPPAGTRPALPVPLSNLVGRDGDVERTVQLIGVERLVTLVGIGGVGKTRLALAVAHRLGPQLVDGAMFVALDGLTATGRDAAPSALADVAEAVCGVYGARADASPGTRVSSGAGTDAVTQLVDAVRGQRGVLVLDNCEHVVGAVAGVVARVLAAAPGLRVLATSREPLELPGEALHPVEPLAVDGPAVALFAARAAAADPGFALDATTEADVAAICRRLDGIPLAIELAAARVRSLGLRTLAERLGDRFAVLAGGRRGSPARQQTLRATLDWSWDLLTDAERAVLRRLSVCASGWTLEAAEDICAGPGVLDTVAQLVDRSLVVRAGTRYRMLDSVVAYAAERLAESGEVALVRDRHLAHHLALAERAAPQLRGREQRIWLELLDAESANMRVALDHAIAAADATAALRLVDALAWYWFLRGRPGEGIRAASAALAAAPPDAGGPRTAVRVWRAGFAIWARNGAGPDEAEVAELAEGEPLAQHSCMSRKAWLLARARWFLAFVQWVDGNPAVALDRVNAALRTFRAVSDPWGTAAALATRASYALLRDDLPAARRDAERADALFGELGDRWGRLQAMDTLATVAEVTGDYAEAARQHSAGLRIAEDLALWPEISGQLSGLGRIALLTGDLDAADAHHERARQLAAERSNTGLVSYAEFGLALAARRRGDLDTTERLLSPWLDADGGATGFAALTPLAELGFVAELRGDGERALALHRNGYREARATGGPRAVALALEGMAGALSLLGEHARATRLLGTADATRRGTGAPLPPAERGDVERITARTRSALGEAAFAAAFAEGIESGPGVADGRTGRPAGQAM